VCDCATSAVRAFPVSGDACVQVLARSDTLEDGKATEEVPAFMPGEDNWNGARNRVSVDRRVRLAVPAGAPSVDGTDIFHTSLL